MKNEELKKAIKEIAELHNNELKILFAIVHGEMCKREAIKMILRIADKQK
jgi:hypothetical protein